MNTRHEAAQSAVRWEYPDEHLHVQLGIFKPLAQIYDPTRAKA